MLFQGRKIKKEGERGRESKKRRGKREENSPNNSDYSFSILSTHRMNTSSPLHHHVPIVLNALNQQLLIMICHLSRLKSE